MTYLEVYRRKAQKQSFKMLKLVEQINLQNIEHYEYIFSEKRQIEFKLHRIVTEKILK